MTTFLSPAPIAEHNLNTAAQSIGNMFDWKSTKEGYDFWDNVMHRLHELADEAKLSQSPSFTKQPNTNKEITIPPTVKADSISYVHALFHGHSVCGTPKGIPRTWPTNHQWTYVKDIDNVDCVRCVERLIAEPKKYA